MTLTEQPSVVAGPSEPEAEAAGADVDVLFDRLVWSLRSLGDRELIRRSARFEQRLERQRLVAAARVAGSSGDVAADRKRARGLFGWSGPVTAFPES